MLDGTYRSPRVWRDLRDWGERIGENRVARLTRQSHLQARHKRRELHTDLGIRTEHRIAPSVLDRQFAVERPNRKWAADFAYLCSAEGWLYVAVVIDLFSRKVVNWSMQPHDDCAAGNRCAQNGTLAKRKTHRAAAPLRPRQPVHQRAVSVLSGCPRHRVRHEQDRRLLGYSVQNALRTSDRSDPCRDWQSCLGIDLSTLVRRVSSRP